MILSTHAIVGAALASVLPANPALVFVAGVVSHFAIDAIPHWDYPLRGFSVSKDAGAPLRFSRALVRDCLLIALDACVGLALALAFFGPTGMILLGAVSAMLPDPLQFVYRIYPHQPLRTLQRFHQWIHSDWRLRWPIGVSSQIAFAYLFVTVTDLIR